MIVDDGNSTIGDAQYKPRFPMQIQRHRRDSSRYNNVVHGDAASLGCLGTICWLKYVTRDT
jgi:hypothetical protein